ncbi:hypothetical protein P154DRAFT_610139 [Amniculicola lignicola CBS 123094]|uniref:Uncharacterized protein n=1 Tax=Amniculicola lignicola CBS 123094 TaxID=1392246 RepID=A0A6A5W3Q3_9PLEO|nr:hypothetical protein P154DRAFT_610139 [Amniculicola lignicola CBS 123094]
MSEIKEEDVKIEKTDDGEQVPGSGSSASQSTTTYRTVVTYPKSHIADGAVNPCTNPNTGGLEHLLFCGHTVGTDDWEQCAANCQYIAQIRVNINQQMWAEIKEVYFPSLDEQDRFMCRACYEEAIDRYVMEMGHEAMTEKDREEMIFDAEELKSAEPEVNWRATSITSKVVTEHLVHEATLEACEYADHILDSQSLVGFRTQYITGTNLHKLADCSTPSSTAQQTKTSRSSTPQHPDLVVTSTSSAMTGGSSTTPGLRRSGRMPARSFATSSAAQVPQTGHQDETAQSPTPPTYSADHTFCHLPNTPSQHLLACGHVIQTPTPHVPCCKNCAHVSAAMDYFEYSCQWLEYMRATLPFLDRREKERFWCAACVEEAVGEELRKADEKATGENKEWEGMSDEEKRIRVLFPYKEWMREWWEIEWVETEMTSGD